MQYILPCRSALQVRLLAQQESAKYAVHSTAGADIEGHKGKEGCWAPTLSICNAICKMQFYGFAFICTAGAKRDQKWGIIAIETESRFAESGASRGFNLVANCKKQVDKCKNRPLAAKSNLSGNSLQFWF